MTTSVQSAVMAPRSAFRFEPSMAEYCQTVLDRLGLNSRHAVPAIRTLGLTSCGRGEGVTTVVTQLAAAASGSLGAPVVLVDCNLAAPGVHRTFGVPVGPGLKDALATAAPVSQFLQPGPVANLSLLTAGDPKHGSAVPFSSPTLGRLMQELKEEYSLILLDLPSFGLGVPGGVSKLVDGLLLVLESEKVRWEVARRTATSLTSAGVNLLGAVMNKQQYHVPDWLYHTL
jgi:Mrp family chromosome partitioning ATPase